MRARSRFPPAWVPPIGRRVLLVCLLVLVGGGCRNPCELVEADLRTKENQIYQLRDENCRLYACNEALEREVQSLRGAVRVIISLPRKLRKLTRSAASPWVGRPAASMRMAGPAMKALQVLVEPRDADGHTLKVPGTLVIRTLEITPEGIKKPLSAWEISGDPLRRSLAQWVVQHGL